MKKQREEITIKDLINIFIPKLWIIVIVAVVFGAFIGVKTAFFESDTYTSSMQIYFYNTDQQASMYDKGSDAMVEISEVLVKSDEFLKKIVASCPDRGLTPSYLRSTISFYNLKNGYLEISVTTTDSTLSLEVARSIENLLPDMMIEKIKDAQSFTIIESPNPSNVPNSKHIVKDVLIATLCGAVLSAVVIWVISVFDVVIHDKKKIEDNFDIPILGVIPRQELKKVVANGEEEAN